MSTMHAVEISRHDMPEAVVTGVREVWPVRQATRAHALMESSVYIGKIMLSRHN